MAATTGSGSKRRTRSGRSTACGKPGGASPTLPWLLEGDPAIRWQALADLADAPGADVERERARVALTGWGGQLLALQAEDGTWGGGLYSPKWTSTTYTLLLLRACGIGGDNRQAARGAALLLDKGLYADGGMNFWFPRWRRSETCVTGMALAIASRFLPHDERNGTLARHLLNQQMPDGGWNCRRPLGAVHSSMHTTISALEGLLEYEQSSGSLSSETRAARERAHDFLFRHGMFRSHRTGRVIDSKMTRFPFPPQWHYDVLRGLDYLRAVQAARDPRLAEAIELVASRRGVDGAWAMPALYPGRYHFEMEIPGRPSRWNTLRALRVLRWWQATPEAARS